MSSKFTEIEATIWVCGAKIQMSISGSKDFSLLLKACRFTRYVFTICLQLQFESYVLTHKHLKKWIQTDNLAHRANCKLYVDQLWGYVRMSI